MTDTNIEDGDDDHEHFSRAGRTMRNEHNAPHNTRVQFISPR